VIRFRGRVEYHDGASDEFECGTAAVAAWELYAARHKIPYGDESPPTLSNLVIAHHALAIEEGFEPWRERVDGVEVTVIGAVAETGGEAPSVPPTSEDPSTA
jgi:hypothetical protein